MLGKCFPLNYLLQCIRCLLKPTWFPAASMGGGLRTSTGMPFVDSTALCTCGKTRVLFPAGRVQRARVGSERKTYAELKGFSGRDE